MPKRAYGSAFASSTPNRMLSASNSKQSPTSDASTPNIYVPGQWPLEDGLTFEHDNQWAIHSSTPCTTAGKWVAIVADVSTLFNLPYDYARKFLRRQRIAIVPILGDNGSSKRRLVDAGFANEPKKTSPTRRSHAKAVRRYKSQSLAQSQGVQRIEATEDPNDDTLDFSFSDILNSSPPHQSPLQPSVVPSSSKRRRRSPHKRTPPHSHTRKTNSSKKGLKKSPSRRSSASHCPSDTIARRRLVKMQLRILSESQNDEEQGIPEPNIASDTEAQHMSHLSDMPVATADSLPLERSPSPSRTDIEGPAAESQAPSTPPPEHEPEPESESSSPISPENDLSFVLFEELPTPPESAKPAQQASTRPFYFDERADKILDCTVPGHHITSSPIKSLESTTGKPEPKTPVAFPIREESHSDSEESEPEAERDFGGIFGDIFEDFDNSLGELQLSTELLETLQEDWKKKLELAPLPPAKPLVASLSVEEMEKLEGLAKAAEYGRNPAFDIISEKLNARDFGTLLPERFSGDPKAWLNDNIVNEYLAIHIAHMKKQAGFEHKRGGPAPPVHAFSSFWYSSAVSRPKSVERWASRVQLGGQQFLDAELILYPICDGGHWRLLVVKPKQRAIEYFDSLGFGGDKYIHAFKEYIKRELGDAWIEEEWIVAETQRSSRQLNGSDCGVFTLLNALVVMREEEAKRVIASCGMQEARERIAITLMARQPTTEWD